MKRLTYVDKQSRKIYLYSSSADVIGKLAEYEDLEEQCIKENAIGIKLLIEKWKEFLEDMHELLEYRKLKAKGRLQILPCAVGDTVYVPHRGHIQEMIITMVSWDGTGYFFSWRLNSGVYPNLDGFSEHKIGKTVFLTREEAKAALEKMKGEEHE